ncbi:microfibrillar-associated protein 1-like [Artemia franciscana]|uniref:Micro-fibrillar-associated protein 1 C-terminal domain-containing protein n=1 Tax=Artemia franciscana TaxID=6661 RepID=A0AA88HZW8_ARTSF|nr:hypothetical protein QYM36_003487 [Artemia franciscana]
MDQQSGSTGQYIIGSTAGAIPVKTDKGQFYMQKVKVQRYVSGKRPDFAKSSSESDSEDEDVIAHRKYAGKSERAIIDRESSPELPPEAYDDPRLRRLRIREVDEDREERHRQIHEPEVYEGEVEREYGRRDSDEEDEELSEDEIERKRHLLRLRALQKREEDELLAKEDDFKSEAEEIEESEYEEYTDSEEEAGPRLKPVFVRKTDRVTVAEKEKEEMKQKQAEVEAKKLAEERRRYTLKMVEQEIKKESQAKHEELNEGNIADIVTDDENEEAEYEAWKIRELKRIKRDREEREQMEKEKEEIERLRNMTEDQRRAELRHNPKVVTNKASKGKYKFLQKYYHRGAFFMDKEEDVYKRDFSAETLEDRFNKQVLPKVMQVKNFGRSGRTKYTHLVDQDTTIGDSPWISETSTNLKFFNNVAGGMRNQFEKPSSKKRKMH